MPPRKQPKQRSPTPPPPPPPPPAKKRAAAQKGNIGRSIQNLRSAIHEDATKLIEEIPVPLSKKGKGKAKEPESFSEPEISKPPKTLGKRGRKPEHEHEPEPEPEPEPQHDWEDMNGFRNPTPPPLHHESLPGPSYERFSTPAPIPMGFSSLSPMGPPMAHQGPSMPFIFSPPPPPPPSSSFSPFEIANERQEAAALQVPEGPIQPFAFVGEKDHLFLVWRRIPRANFEFFLLNGVKDSLHVTLTMDIPLEQEIRGMLGGKSMPTKFQPLVMRWSIRIPSSKAEGGVNTSQFQGVRLSAAVGGVIRI